MASQVQTTSLRARKWHWLPAESERNLRSCAVSEPELLSGNALGAREGMGGLLSSGIFAHGMEFVALPGMAEKLQTIIPEAMSEAFGHRGSFSGCIAQVSDAEMGLMNVITLWTGKDRAKHCANSKERMNQVLLPYVDRWARTRRMTTLLCVL